MGYCHQLAGRAGGWHEHLRLWHHRCIYEWSQTSSNHTDFCQCDFCLLTCAWYSKSSATLSSSSDIQLWCAEILMKANHFHQLLLFVTHILVHKRQQRLTGGTKCVCRVFKIKALSFLIEGKCASDIFGFSKYKPLVLYRKLFYWPQVCVLIFKIKVMGQWL